MVSGFRFAARPRIAMQALLVAALLNCPLSLARAQEPAAAPAPAAMPGVQPGAMPAAQPAAPTAPAQTSAVSPEDAAKSFLISTSGGLPWEVAVMFTAFWVLMAAEIAIISKPSKRLDKPPKLEKALQAD